ncbi:MAG: hypothetical protein Q7S56_02240 [Nanoarchaeota archaeon]|nr:hypothetical protein [Nanoarchaeota archaeon]
MVSRRIIDADKVIGPLDMTRNQALIDLELEMRSGRPYSQVRYSFGDHSPLDAEIRSNSYLAKRLTKVK